MENFPLKLVLTLSTALFITGPIQAQTNESNPNLLSGSVAAAETNQNNEVAPGNGLQMVFRGARLDKVLSYFSSAAGFVIYLRPGVQVDGTIDVWSEQPLSREEALKLLKTVLHDHGCSVLQENRTLTILRTEDMTTVTPVRLGGDPAQISSGAEVVTQIIPVRTLNPAELVKLLTPLLPPRALLAFDESANALLLTATESDVHRAAEIIAALDSVSSTANTLRVFPLQFADAKMLADAIKELFSAPEAAPRSPGNVGRGNLIRLPGARGPASAAAPGNFAMPEAGQTPVSRVAAVPDEHGNAVIVSAPEAMFPAIEKLVFAVDVEVQDVTAVESFTLINADPAEMATLLENLFPDPGSSADASSRIQFNGQGGRGATGGVRQANADGAAGASDRMRKMGRVLAVPDPRTSTVIVCAAKSLMPEIAALVKKLDLIDMNRRQVRIFGLANADPYEVQRVLQELYSTGNSTVATASQNDLLALRIQSLGAAQFSTGSGSGLNNLNRPTTSSRGQ